THYGYDFTDDELKAFNGPPLVDTFKNLNADLADEMVQTYRKHNLANHDQYVKVFPDVLETIEHLYKRNIPMGVVSAKDRKSTRLNSSHVSISYAVFCLK